ncbi:VOC family protein [Heyndrickxia sp. NPDC080065]|uniref:VOC family protein n=1 Tax=Heyndrickxia sp. NPDC080065 TaxID=3390568 RepID=UPI003D083551
MNSPINNQINTIFVHASDLKKSVQWYSKLLGQEYDPTEVSNPVYNIKINHHTGLTLDAGPEGVTKQPNTSSYPLFNFHTNDIHRSYDYVRQLDYKIESDIVHFPDFSFFTISDPDRNIIMICTG